MKIVADTNVLISGSYWKGDPYKIIGLSEKGKIELLTSKDIIDEFLGVVESKEFKDKIKRKQLAMQRDVQKLCSFALFIEPREKICFVKEDPDDDKILECAAAGNADFIVTKDNHLLKLKEFRGMKIMRPEEFLKMVK